MNAFKESKKCSIMNNVLTFAIIFVNFFSSCSDGGDGIEPLPPPPTPPIVKDTIWSNYLSPSFNLLKDSVWENNNGHSYYVKSRLFYFDQKSRANCFLGQLVNSDLKHNKTTESVKSGLKYYPLMCGGLDTLVFKIELPSTNSMDSILQVINKYNIENHPVTFIYNEDEYKSPKELYLLFSYNNLRMDSLIYNEKYNKVQMNKKNGYIYTSTELHYTLYIDTPRQLLMNEYIIDEFDKSKIAYIKSIGYGKIKYLLVETDFTKEQVKQSLTKVKNKEALTIEESSILSTSNIYMITVDSDGINKVKGEKDVIDNFYHNKEYKTTELYCTFSQYTDNSASEIQRIIDFQH